MRMASAIFETSALTKVCPLGALSGRLSDRRSLYLPASSRLRCVPTSPVAPVISTVFISPFRNSGSGPELVPVLTPNSGPVLCIQCALRRPALHDLGGLRHRFHRLVLDRRERKAGGMRRGDYVGPRGEARRRHLVGRAADVHGEAGEVAGIERRFDGLLVDEIAARYVDETGTALHLFQ